MYKNTLTLPPISNPTLDILLRYQFTMFGNIAPAIIVITTDRTDII